MKSYIKALISIVALAEVANAMEHPSLTSSNDYEEKWNENVADKNSSYRAHMEKHEYNVIDHARRPVIGVLTEPLRGELYKKVNSRFKVDELIETDTASYVPKAHVQFLEQAGVRVVPIDYRLTLEERRDLLDQLNGVYLPGDSHNTVTDENYKTAFVQTLAYVENATFENNEHFPMFLMGNSLGTLVRARQASGSNLSDMGEQRYSSSRLEMLGHPSDYFLLNGLEREDK